jgi:hypothetical protein
MVDHQTMGPANRRKEQLGDEPRVGHKDAAWMVFVDSKNERASL